MSTYATITQLNGRPACNGPDNHVKDHTRVGEGHCHRPPLVREQLGDGKGGKLGIAGTKANDGHGGDHLRGVLRPAADDEPNEQEYVAEYDEPSPSKEITIRCKDV